MSEIRKIEFIVYDDGDAVEWYGNLKDATADASRRVKGGGSNVFVSRAISYYDDEVVAWPTIDD